MNLSKNYLNSLKQKVNNWELADHVEILKEKIIPEIDAGFLRIKIILQNTDILEFAVYFLKTESGTDIKSYTFHWQDSEGNLKKRWDNANHHTKVSSFPFHVHDGEEENVEASEPMDFEKVMQAIEKGL